jgi:hypothetical protein
MTQKTMKAIADYSMAADGSGGCGCGFHSDFPAQDGSLRAVGSRQI